MTSYIDKPGLKVATELAGFVKDLVIPGTGSGRAFVWNGAPEIFERFVPRNCSLRAMGDKIQVAVNRCHRERYGQRLDLEANKKFISGIGLSRTLQEFRQQAEAAG